MSNWKVGPGGRLYHPTTGAYVGQLDDNGNEQMVVSSFPSEQGGVFNGRGLAAQAGSSAVTLQLAPDIANLPAPFFIPHRGAGGLVAPNAQLESYDIGLSYGFGIIDGGDWLLSSDGHLVNCHDDTVDALTTGTGNVTSFTLAQLKALTLDCSAYFGGGWPDATGLYTAKEFFGRYAGRTCFAPEPKSLAAAKKLAGYLKTAGLERSCLINSFTAAWLAPFVAAEFPYVALNIDVGGIGSGLTLAQCQAWKAAGYTHVNIPYSVAVDNATTAQAAGLKVIVGSVPPSRQVQRKKWDGIADAFTSDDPVYFSGQTEKYRLKSDPYGSGYYYHGHQSTLASSAPSVRGTMTSDGYLTWTASTAKQWFLLGWACPVEKAADTYSINLSLRFDTLPSNTALGFSFFIGMPTDDAFNDSFAAFEKGYFVSISAAGTLSIRKRTPLDGAAITQSTAAAVAGAVMSIRIDVTPAEITVTRTDVASPNSVVRVDGEHRGGYIFYGSPAAAGGDTMAVHSLKATIS